MGGGGDNDVSDIHGKYCGFSANGQDPDNFDPNTSDHLNPEDELDNACKYHDNAYKTFKKAVTIDKTLERLDTDLVLLAYGVDYFLQRPLDSSHIIEGLGAVVGAIAYFIAEFTILIPTSIINEIGRIFGISIF